MRNGIHDQLSSPDAQRVRMTVMHRLSIFAGQHEGRSVTLQHRRLGRIAIRGERLRPAASIMKLALVAAVLREHELGRLHLDQVYPVASFGATCFPSVLAAFGPDHMFKLREICRLALLTSDNPLAVFLTEICPRSRVLEALEAIGIAGNRCALEAGYTDPELGARNRGNLLSANDSLILLRHLCRYRDIAAALENNIRNTRIPALLPAGAKVAHKTGTLDGVANDVGRIIYGNTTLWLAFLTEGEPDLEASAAEIAACSRDVLEQLLTWEAHSVTTDEEPMRTACAQNLHGALP